MKYKAYDLMKAAAENPKECEGRRYKVLSYAVDSNGRKITELKINEEGEFVSNDGWQVYIKNDTILEEIPPEPEPKPVPFMEAVKAYSEGKTIRCEVVPSVTNQVYEYEPFGNGIELHGYKLATYKGSGTPVTTKEILEGKWFIEE